MNCHYRQVQAATRLCQTIVLLERDEYQLSLPLCGYVRCTYTLCITYLSSTWQLPDFHLQRMFLKTFSHAQLLIIIMATSLYLIFFIKILFNFYNYISVRLVLQYYISDLQIFLIDRSKADSINNSIDYLDPFMKRSCIGNLTKKIDIVIRYFVFIFRGQTFIY